MKRVNNVEKVSEFLNFNFSPILDIAEFSFLKNMDFEVKAEGANLSEGQKTIIQLLRAVLLRPTILCLDEFNSDLDNNTGTCGK